MARSSTATRAPAAGRHDVRASVVGAVALATTSGVLTALAWRAGGYFPAAHLTAGAVAFGVLAVLACLRRPPRAARTPALASLGALAALAAWTAISARWAPSPDTAMEDAQRVVVYLGLLGLALMAARHLRRTGIVVWAVLGVIAVLVGAGLLSRLFPELLGYDRPPSTFLGYRLSYPLGYWNAFGSLGAMGVVIAASLAADARSRPWARGVASALAVGLCATAFLSFSRGAIIALAVGLLVAVLVTSRRWSLLGAIAIVAPFAAAAILRVDGVEALTTRSDGGAAQADAGAAYAPFLLGCMLLAGVAQTALARGARNPLVVAAQDRLARPLTVVVTAVAIVGALGVYVVWGDTVEGRTASAIERVERFAEREWDEFMRPGQFQTGEGTERLATGAGTRSDLYRIAIDGFEARPLVGEGSGAFEYRFARDRKIREKVRDAHSLPLETLSELGLIGGVLLALFLGGVVAALRRERRTKARLTGAQVAAVAGGCAAWLAHAAVDWAWQLPAVTGCALLLAAAVLSTGRTAPSAPVA
jgi:hypothetical protein